MCTKNKEEEKNRKRSKILNKILAEVSAHFKDTENFIKKDCRRFVRPKISLEQVNFFCFFHAFPDQSL